jgi:DNA-binding protein HU-beta
MASGPMTKSQLINTIAEETEVPRKTAQRMLEVLGEVAYKEAKKGFTLPGLGKLVLVNRKARTGRNPATGEAIKIPAKKVLKFRIAKAAKDAIIGVKKAK